MKQVSLVDNLVNALEFKIVCSCSVRCNYVLDIDIGKCSMFQAVTSFRPSAYTETNTKQQQPLHYFCSPSLSREVGFQSKPRRKTERFVRLALNSRAVLASKLAATLSTEKPKLAIFVSGGGSNFQEIHKATTDQRIPASVAVVVTNKKSCGAASYAKEAGIPVVIYPATGPPENEESSAGSPEQLRALLTEAFRTDYVLLAGYLKLVPKEVVAAFPRAILNIHPSLLPAFGGKGFYGSKVHEAVVASGARFTGPTVHFVDEHFDTGPILAQRVIPVNPLESPQQVASRVLREVVL